jgi:hypothetical protein
MPVFRFHGRQSRPDRTRALAGSSPASILMLREQLYIIFKDSTWMVSPSFLPLTFTRR